MDQVKEKEYQDLIFFFVFKRSKWFYENCMVLSSGKCHFIRLEKDAVSDSLRFCGEHLKASEFENFGEKKLTKS